MVTEEHPNLDQDGLRLSGARPDAVLDVPGAAYLIQDP